MANAVLNRLDRDFPKNKSIGTQNYEKKLQKKLNYKITKREEGKIMRRFNLQANSCSSPSLRQNQSSHSASRQRHSELTRSVSDDFVSKVGPKDEFTIPSNALDQSGHLKNGCHFVKPSCP
jgi:hypothetical protein